jgi:hypothetical protein
MPFGGARDEAFEARFADIDIAYRRRQHAAIADQEGFGGESPDGDARGDRQRARYSTSSVISTARGAS